MKRVAGSSGRVVLKKRHNTRKGEKTKPKVGEVWEASDLKGRVEHDADADHSRKLKSVVTIVLLAVFAFVIVRLTLYAVETNDKDLIQQILSVTKPAVYALLIWAIGWSVYRVLELLLGARAQIASPA